MAPWAGTGRTRCGGGDPVSKLTQVAWRAGGVWVLARGALMPRRLVRVVLFAAASAAPLDARSPSPGLPMTSGE